MAEANISGTSVQNITSISGAGATSITAIAGVPTSTIPGWPGSAPSCTSTPFGYSDGRRNPPEQSCLATPQDYDFDAINNLLYLSGECGSIYPIAGYYSDGGNIYFWDGVGGWSFFSPCPR